MDPQILVQRFTIVVAVVGSSLATIGLPLKQMNRLETKLETRIAGLDTKFTDKLDSFDTKFTDKLDSLDTKFTDKLDSLGGDVIDVRERLARVEGHLMAPESFTRRTPQPPAAVDPPAEDPGTGHRHAG